MRALRSAASISFRALALIALAAFPACNGASAPAASPAAGPAATTLDARRAALRDLIAEAWEVSLRKSPEFASTLGDPRYNDRWSDYSEAAIAEDIADTHRFLARLEAIDPSGFPEQERLSYALFGRDLKLDAKAEPLEPWWMPVNQFRGVHAELAELVSQLTFNKTKDYEDYLARLRAIPTVLDQVTARMRKGMAKRLMPPKFLLGKVAEQADAIAAPAPKASAFAAPLANFPDAVKEADRARLRASCLATIADAVDPAYRRFAQFVRAEYEPNGRAEPGVRSLPDGAERYALAVERSTSTHLTADEIHAMGLREVARIEGEMLGVATKLGMPDLASLSRAIASEPSLHFASRQAIIDRYRHFNDLMYPKLPSLFGRLPKAKLEVLPVEDFRETSAAAAEYEPGTPDGSRPGHVMVNTGNFADRTTTTVETTAYHEGVPGHHLQIAIAQELAELPPFRQHYFVTAFVEGWALYSERLGEEVGLFQDPYSYYGHLQDEMLRAIRLVVDTGVHARKWTRQQMVDFFHAHSTEDEVSVQAETDRYIAVPAQALAYKVGQLEILALRDKARAALGPKFDIREFHDVVLGSGALPLDTLEQQVRAWIERRRGA